MFIILNKDIMYFINTRNNQEKAPFHEAVLKGLASNKGLFVPEKIPLLSSSFFDEIISKSDHEIAFEVLWPYMKESVNAQQLKGIIRATLSFPLPLVPVNHQSFSLELFHGPTQAFKDVGARFMSRCLAFFSKASDPVTVLVATSGDTGSAVANGFYNVDGVEVRILFPKGKISAYQEFQMTSLGKNIHPIEVDGTFDDCQQLVKEAFQNEVLNQQLNLSSANSINIARLLPQMLYYFLAWKQAQIVGEKEVVFSVPSGNLGNLTAGIMAKKMGLPVKQFIAAMNNNDAFTNYLSTGDYLPKSSLSTYSNAMDVGAPSNFERLLHFYSNDWDQMKTDISSYSISNEETLQEMRKTYAENKYLLDPHGAVGKRCLERYLQPGQVGIFLETAHPRKFEEVVRKAIPEFPDIPVSLSNHQKQTISNSFEELKEVLLQV